MTFFNEFIYVSVVLFILMLIFFIRKINYIREKFQDIFHITDAADFNYNKIYINPDNSYTKDTKKGDIGMYFNRIYVTSFNRLFVGNSAVAETSVTHSDLNKIKNTNFPYIKKTNKGERLQFNRLKNNKYYLDADNLRALQGKQLVPLYNDFYGVNNFALKIEPQRDSFETGGLTCGFMKDASYAQTITSGIINSNKAY